MNTPPESHHLLLFAASVTPFLIITSYTLFLHVRVILNANGPLQRVVLTAAGGLLMLVTNATLRYSLFMGVVAPDLIGYIRDMTFLLNGFLTTAFVDQISDRENRAGWIARFLLMLIPVAHSTVAFLERKLYQDGFLVALWSVTLYTVACAIYSIASLIRLYRHVPTFHGRWRIGTLILGCSMLLLYVLGRRVLGFHPSILVQNVPTHLDPLNDLLDAVNQVTLTLTAVFLALGMTMPAWYRRMASVFHVAITAEQHLDNLIAMIGRISDAEVRLRSSERAAVRTVANWLASEMGMDPLSQKIVHHLAIAAPIERVVLDRPLPPERLIDETRLDIASTIMVVSEVYEMVQQIERGVPLTCEAKVVYAARLYVEGHSLERIRRVCPRPGALLSQLIERSSEAATGSGRR